VLLLSQGNDLFRFESGVGEHADLIHDVRPVLRVACGLELLDHRVAHLIDASTHLDQLPLPHAIEFRGVQNLKGQAGALQGRTRLHAAHDDLELGGDSLLLLFVVADHGNAPYPVSVQTEVLGEGLGGDDRVALLLEHADNFTVLVEVASGESLLCGVE